MRRPPSKKIELSNSKTTRLVRALLPWFVKNARELPWRRTTDPYAIWVSEVMLQQTQVKTVVPFWERWMRELPTLEALADAPSEKIHKLWEGLGYYTRVRNMQKAARQIVRGAESHDTQKNGDSQSSSLRSRRVSRVRFPERFEEVLALPGVGRYTAGALCSIAFNQPTPILDGNVIRVLTRIFAIEKNPRDKKTNHLLWRTAGELVRHAKDIRSGEGAGLAVREDDRPAHCSLLNQALMELGALVCTPRNPECNTCPVKTVCVAFKESRVDELPNLGARQKATAREFAAFVVERNGKFLVRQRPAGVVNAHLWEFPNAEINGRSDRFHVAKSVLGVAPQTLAPLGTIRHSITRYRIRLEAHRAELGGRPAPAGRWLKLPELEKLSFPSAHKKILAKLRRQHFNGASSANP